MPRVLSEKYEEYFQVECHFPGNEEGRKWVRNFQKHDDFKSADRAGGIFESGLGKEVDDYRIIKVQEEKVQEIVSE